jgi:putative transposase
VVLQVAGRRAPAAGRAAGAAESPDRGAVRPAQGQGRVTADHRRAAGGGLDGQREHRRWPDAPDGPGRPARAQAQGRHPAGEGPAGRQGAPDLVKRNFPAQAVNRKWYGDGTEIPTGEGKLHLDSVLDMGSRRILGHAPGEHHDAELAYGALAMAVAVRGGAVPGVIMHTDQGSEYTASRFRGACTRLGIRQSMGRPGSALDNAVIESWHSTVEFELRRIEQFADKAAARAGVAAWIEDCNHERRHSALGMMSPVDYERSLAGKDAA